MIADSVELQKDAQLVIEVLNDKAEVQLDFSSNSVSWLDTYIEQHRDELNERDKTLLQEKFGAYLGESIRRNYGGRWVKGSGDRWMIVFDEEHQALPFEIIGAHLDHHTALTEVFEHLPDHCQVRQN